MNNLLWLTIERIEESDAEKYWRLSFKYLPIFLDEGAVRFNYRITDKCKEDDCAYQVMEAFLTNHAKFRIHAFIERHLIQKRKKHLSKKWDKFSVRGFELCKI